MQIDLAAVADQLKGRTGKVSARWTGGQVEVDEVEFIGRVADAAAHTMGANLYAGRTPDGAGAMPGRKKDGKPRGFASQIARALAARLIGPGTWFIAAHKEIQGHLARIMQDVPLKAPPLSTLGPAIKAAFARAVKTSQGATSSVFGEALRTGSRTVWSGGKRVAIGKLFDGGAVKADLSDFASARRTKQIIGRLRTRIQGPRPAGPRPRSPRGGWGALRP